jgi:hypothetical protein
MSLSDNKLRNIKAPNTGKREIADRDGLTARITANAIITFNYRFRWQGKQQRIKIGRYPEIKLSDARITSGEYRKALLDGFDPRSYAVSQKTALDNQLVYSLKNFIFHKIIRRFGAYMDAPVNARFNEDTVCCHISRKP